MSVMMKLNVTCNPFTSVVLVMALSFGLSSCSEDKKAEEVVATEAEKNGTEQVAVLPGLDEAPENAVELSKSFMDNFPEANDAQWSREGENYEVSFTNASDKMEVLFDKDGKWLEKEISVSADKLPQTIKDYITENYAGYQLEESEKVSKSEGGVFYEVEIKQETDGAELKKELVFDASGTFITSEKEGESDVNDDDSDEE